MEKKIQDLEWYQSFRYNGYSYFIKPNQQRINYTLCVKKQGGEIKEFKNDTIVII